jgi:hypothetical protein
MGGCTNCTGKTGCDHRKGDMLALIADTLAALYPTRTWGQPDDEARFGVGVSVKTARALASALAKNLRAASYFRRGRADEACHFIYILCVGRQPSLVEIRDAGVAVPDELASSPGDVHELYLRVCLSDMAMVAGVQEVSMSLLDLGDRLAVIERPRGGVYQPPLLSRMRKLVATLPAYGIRHLDFGEISAPPADYLPGDYAARYGGLPCTANYLFYPQPITAETTTVLEGQLRAAG